MNSNSKPAAREHGQENGSSDKEDIPRMTHSPKGDEGHPRHSVADERTWNTLSLVGHIEQRSEVRDERDVTCHRSLLTTPTIDDSQSRPHPPPHALLPASPGRQNGNNPLDTDPISPQCISPFGPFHLSHLPLTTVLRPKDGRSTIVTKGGIRNLVQPPAPRSGERWRHQCPCLVCIQPLFTAVNIPSP